MSVYACTNACMHVRLHLFQVFLRVIGLFRLFVRVIGFFGVISSFSVSPCGVNGNMCVDIKVNMVIRVIRLMRVIRVITVEACRVSEIEMSLRGEG